MNGILNQVGSVKRSRTPSVLRVFPLAWVAWLLALFLSAGPAPRGLAQTNTVRPPANRWLLIVQTSAAMRRRAEAVPRIAAALLWSGMNEQMRPGDTVGLWTFNKELHAGVFPLQLWTPGTRQRIAAQVYEFLKDQKYEHNGPLDTFLPAMEKVLRSSDFITVVLISDGREKIHYTPFDAQINAVYKTWGQEREQVRIPFVTVLRAQHGQITNYVVAIPPWPLELPPLPPELARAGDSQPEQKPQPPPPPLAPPLILSGKKPEPTPPPPPSEPTVSNASPATLRVTNAALTHEPVPAPAPVTPARPAEPSATVAEHSKPPIAVPDKPVEAVKPETALPAPPRTVAAATTNETRAPPAVFSAAPAFEPNAAPPAAARPRADRSTTPTPVETAVPGPQEETVSSRNRLIVGLGMIGLGLAIIILGIVYLLARGPHPALRIRLDSHSPDRDKRQ